MGVTGRDGKLDSSARSAAGLVRSYVVGTKQERRASIRAVIAILLAQPQPMIDAPAAQVARPGLGLPDDFDAEQSTEPLSYRQLPEMYSALQAKRQRKAAAPRATRTVRAPSPETARVNARQKPNRGSGRPARSASVANSKKEPEQRRRPGTGGRKPRVVAGTATTATAQLQAALGEPTKVQTGRRGAKSEIWVRPNLEALLRLIQEREGRSAEGEPAQSRATSEPKPRVAVVNRLSSQEIQGGETIAGQIFDGLRTAQDNNCDVVAVIASTNYGSELTFEERDDFRWIVEQAELGQLDGVVFREPDRIARKQAVVHPFYDKCKRLDLDIYLASLNRKVDWSSEGDQLQISLINALSEVEAQKIARRMQDAKRRRWVEEGRGWPGCKRFGFRRNKLTKHLEVDPEQWPTIELIHNNYGKLSSGRKSGCRALSEKLAEMGIDLSTEKIRKILLDPIYVDGTYTVRVDGQLIACEPIPLEKPIPRAVFQRNQELLVCQKGTYSKVPAGTNALNGVVIEHGACNDQTDPKAGHPPRLRVNNSRAGKPSYRHRGKHPKSCHGYRLEQREFEGAVIRKLLELAEDKEVQEAWSAAALVIEESQESTCGDVEAELETSLEIQRLQMTEKVANLEAELERQLEQLVEMAGAGETITATHRALAERLEESLNVSRKRLSVLEANAARRSEEREQEAGRSKEELLDALKAVLTEEIPKDDGRRARRQAILECCLSKIVVHDVASGDGTSSDATPSGAGQDPYDGKGYEIELFGPLVPKTIVEGGSSGGSGRSGGSSSSAYNTLPVSPLDAAGHLLEAELRESEAAEAEAEGAAVGHGNSSTQVETYKEVFRLRNESKSLEARRAQRDQRLLENPWPERFQGHRGERIPVWRSPRIFVGRHSPGDCPATEAQCRQALLEAASTLSPGQRLTWNAYRAWFEKDPKHRPPPWSLRRVATELGMNFAAFRNQVLPPEVSFPERKPDGYWTWERCQEAISCAISEHASTHDRRLTERGYRGLCQWRSDLPSLKRLSKVARENGTSIGAMLKEATRDHG